MARKAKMKKDKVKKVTRKARVAAAPAQRGGVRKGAGRKSIEVHFASINAKLNEIGARLGIVGVPVVTEAPAPIAEAAPTAPVNVKPAKAEKPVKAKRGPKLKTEEPVAEAPLPPAQAYVPPVAEASVQLPVAPVGVAPVMQAAPVAPPQAYVPPAPPPVHVQAQQYAQQQVQAPPVAPVVFTAPPPPPPVQYVGVAPVNSLPVQPTAPTGAPDFNAQFNALPPKQ